MDIILAIRKNVSKVITRSGQTSQAKFAEHCGLAQATINKIFNSDTEIPTTKTILTIAERNGAAPWMLLMNNFPFQATGKKPIREISAEGYRLLDAFEHSSNQTKEAILSQMAFFVQNNEKNEKEAAALMEARAAYKTN